ncbi:MAG: hypothetical protein NTV93_01690 [Verrucomicrobia bacterium]|nr:hypothetical protein [Verrucomicrobiota bacterium]
MFVVVLAGFSTGIAGADSSVYVSRFWHNHQPIYWPEWNGNGSQTSRMQYAWDSIVLKSGQLYGTTSGHPDNNLTDIFGLPDRQAAYQSGPRNSLAGLSTQAGFCMSYSGSLIDNIRSLGTNNQLGYGNGWWSGNREARNWLTAGNPGAGLAGGSRRMDLVGFTYHHSLGPLIPKAVFRKELQIFKQAWWKAWGGNSDLSDHSKGFFPTEMAFTSEMIDVLADEGYQWTIVASHHLSRTCPTYNTKANPTGSFQIKSSPPNKADQRGPSPVSGWWFNEPNPGQAAWNVSPHAYQLHRVKYVNPATGQEKSLIVVPSDDALSYVAGYSGAQVGMISNNIAPFANDPSRPVVVLPCTDGDNAWGGGSSSYFESTPSFFSGCSSNGYAVCAIQDLVNAKPPPAGEYAHVEDGAWIFPESDYGSPYFLKWIEPPVGAPNSTSKVPGTVVDLETPGFALKFWSWAPVITGANWCETAEQMLVDEGGSVQAWKIQAPYDWNGARTIPNDVELGWHIYLGGLDSGFNYYGGLGNDDEVKQSLATRRAIEKLSPFVNARLANDRTPPSVLRPQRFPWNPGAYTFGWFNSIPGGNTSYLKKMPSEFYIWTHAYDISGVGAISVKVRVDNDGVNTMANNQNETYAGGSDVGPWITIPMNKRVLPKTRAELNAAANNGQIDYFITPPELADYYFVKISNANVAGFRGKLLDYYIEATDSKNNTSKSEIQHVFVEDDGAINVPPATPANLAGDSPTGTRINLTWTASPDATSYRILRDGTEIGTSSTASYADTTVSPLTSYNYTIIAVNSAGSSSPTAAFSITSTAPGVDPPAFSMSGTAPAGYLLSNPGMTVYASIRGTKLYVATWYAGSAAGNDHFIFVSNQLLPSASNPVLPGWGKAGLVAVPSTAAVLCMESTNGWAGWQWHNSGGTSLAGQVNKNPSGQLEGTIDLVDAFGSVPPTIYIASAAFQTANGGILGAQAPGKTVDNGNLDPAEFLALPTAAIKDSIGDDKFDFVAPDRKFRAVLAPDVSGKFKVAWPAVPGKTYRVTYKNSLADPAWLTDLPGSTITVPVSSGSAESVFRDSSPGIQQRFYRVELVP